MAAYIVTLPDGAAGTSRERTMIVSAENAGQAKDVCKAEYSGDAGDAAWEAATVTTVSDVTMATAGALDGWRFNVSVRNPSGTETHNFSATGDATDDTLDEIGALLATAGVAAGLTSSYAANVLEVSTIGDAIGDHTVVLSVKTPIVLNSDSRQESSNAEMSDAFLSSYTHEGIAGAVLEVTFVADTILVPKVYGKL